MESDDEARIIGGFDVGVGLLVDELDSIIFREASESSLPGAGVELVHGWYFHEPDNAASVFPQSVHAPRLIDIADFFDTLFINDLRYYPAFSFRRIRCDSSGSVQVQADGGHGNQDGHRQGKTLQRGPAGFSRSKRST